MSDTQPIHFGQSDEQTTSLSPEILKKMTEQMYKQNAELLIRNKTLTILRHLSTQTLQYLDTTEVCQSVANVISQELGLIFVLVSLYDSRADEIVHKAITQDKKVIEAMNIFSEPLSFHKITKEHTSNVIYKTVHNKIEQEFIGVSVLFTPFIPETECQMFEEKLQIKECFLLPIILDGEAIGSLT